MYGNCTVCTRFTRLNRVEICSECFPEDERLLEIAKLTLASDGRMSVFDLADRVETEPERVFQWITQRRIKSNLFRYSCPRCGNDLMNGFCNCDSRAYAQEAEERAKIVTKPPERFYTASRFEKLCRHYWDNVSTIAKKKQRNLFFPSKLP